MDFEILEQSPEIGDGIGDGAGIVRFGFAAWKRGFVAFAGGLFPVFEAMPVETIEIPGDAGTERLEFFEVDSFGLAS